MPANLWARDREKKMLQRKPRLHRQSNSFPNVVYSDVEPTYPVFFLRRSIVTCIRRLSRASYTL